MGSPLGADISTLAVSAPNRNDFVSEFATHARGAHDDLNFFRPFYQGLAFLVSSDNHPQQTTLDLTVPVNLGFLDNIDRMS